MQFIYCMKYVDRMGEQHVLKSMHPSHNKYVKVEGLDEDEEFDRKDMLRTNDEHY